MLGKESCELKASRDSLEAEIETLKQALQTQTASSADELESLRARNEQLESEIHSLREQLDTQQNTQQEGTVQGEYRHPRIDTFNSHCYLKSMKIRN